MNNKEEKSKKNKEKKIKVNKSALIIIAIINIILVVALVVTIVKLQNVKSESNHNTNVEKINKGIYDDMTSKEMYDATRNLPTSEKQGLVEMFIMKWKQDKNNNINSIADNETYARYLFCL